MVVLSEKYTEEEILKKLRKTLDARRYEHSVGVAHTAMAMMMAHEPISADAVWEIGTEKEPSEALLRQKEICAHHLAQAYTAGLLHDCAKCLEDEERDRLIRKYKVELTDIEKEYPYLIHAKLGAVLAKEKYGVNDPAILSAIRFHTTGCVDISLLEAIIFSADFIEPNRKMLHCLPEIRSVIYKDLNKAVYLILAQTLVHLEHKGQPVDESTKQALEWYSKFA